MSDREEASDNEDAGEEGRRKVSSKKERSASGLILQPRERKEKKEKKEKEHQTRYAHLGDDSSGNDDVDGKSPAKSKRSKAAFMFSSAKKDKEKKSARDPSVDGTPGEAAGGSQGQSTPGSAAGSSSKKKDKKEKPKLKLISKSKHHHTDSDDAKYKASEENVPPIFGVPLEVATERNRSHDGIPLPVIVRQCIDYIEDQGLMQEGIYRSSGVKSKINKLRAAFNGRQPVNLQDYEPAVVASVLKQFLRELPDPVLTRELMPRFEAVSADPTPQKRIEGMKQLINAELPECNRTLVQWIFAHMMHVIERERFNKMTLQNVSIVLSPTMQISHRVLNCLFENSHILFGSVQLRRYVPPIMGDGAGGCQSRALPDRPSEIEEEIRKQESLLSDLHLQISSGAASKKVEEQVWEQQRIVTQLKRKLRMAKQQSEGQLNISGAGGDDNRRRFEPIDYEENLNFELQTPKKVEEPEPMPVLPSSGAEEESKRPEPKSFEKRRQEQKEEHHHIQQQQQQLVGNKDTPPEESAKTDTEHKVTVMVHQSEATDKQQHEQGQQQERQPHPAGGDAVDAPPKTQHVTVITLKETAEKSREPDKGVSPTKEIPSPVKEESPQSVDNKKGSASFPLLPPPPASHKMRQGNAVLLRPTPASPMHSKSQQQQQQAPPIKPAQPASAQHFHTSLSVDRGVDLAKSRSLPRGLPSDGSAFDMFAAEETAVTTTTTAAPQSLNPFPSEEAQRQERREQEARDQEMDDLLLDEARARFEFEELSALKSELERRKLSERKEMEELREELATMQTLYQYRTCSVDSSESSSDGEGDCEVGKEASRSSKKESSREEEVEELTRVLKDLMRENGELQEKKQELCQKIQEERAACVNLRVEIRVEQERRKIRQQRKSNANTDLLIQP